jgi:hypothetical protein
MPADNRYAFLVEWLDPQAQLVRQYLLFFYSLDGTVEMVAAPAIPSAACMRVCVRACVRECVRACACMHLSAPAAAAPAAAAPVPPCALPLACEGCALGSTSGVGC